MNRLLRASWVIWLVVGLFSLCVTGVMVLLVHEFARNAESAARLRAEGLARGAETTLNRDFLAFDLTLAGLEQMPGLFDGAGGTVQEAKAPEILRALVNQSLQVRDLMLLDAQGRVAAAADGATSNAIQATTPAIPGENRWHDMTSR